MIKKDLITIQTESWYSEDDHHRYVFRRQWSVAKAKKDDKEEPMAIVITIHPGNTAAFVEDLTLMLVERNVRALGYGGFIAVNLFSSVEGKSIDDITMEAIQTALKEKRVTEVIFACGSILNSNQKAREQARALYEMLSAAQKKNAKVLADPGTDKFAHPLSPYVRKKWILHPMTLDQLGEPAV